MNTVKQTLRPFKQFIKFCIDLVILPAGWIIYLFTGDTPVWAGQNLIRLFCYTGGRSNDVLASFTSLRHPPKKIEIKDGILHDFTDDKLKHALASLNEKGYYIFDQRIPEHLCDMLLKYSLKTPSLLRPVDGASKEFVYEVYNPENPRAPRYDYRQEDLLEIPEVQNLMSDSAFVSLAQSYIGVYPVCDIVAMWWNTSFLDHADGEAAQMYHFDMDRIKWLKFFIYLTDVTPESGPHRFIAGTHKSKSIPSKLLDKGYSRLEDEEVESCFNQEDLIEFDAPRGTIIAEDTRGLHKGQHVMKGHRLLFQLQYSCCLFGHGPKFPKSRSFQIKNSQFRSMNRDYPRLYSAYNFKE